MRHNCAHYVLVCILAAFISGRAARRRASLCMLVQARAVPASSPSLKILKPIEASTGRCSTFTRICLSHSRILPESSERAREVSLPPWFGFLSGGMPCTPSNTSLFVIRCLGCFKCAKQTNIDIHAWCFHSNSVVLHAHSRVSQ